MSDPLEEAEDLELGNWNSSEYDMAIGEEEEERLLEEDDITERTQAFPYEGEAEPAFSDTEFETEEADEEDVLDLGLNEELPEYDEAVSDPQETEKKPSADQSQNKGLVTAEKSGSLFSPKAESSTRQDAIRRNDTNRLPSRGGYQRNFSNNNRPPHIQNSFQMRGGPGPRLRHPGFINQRPPFDGPRPQMGRPPSILDYRPPHGSFVRNPLPLGKPFVLSQDYNHGPPIQRMQRYGFEEQQQHQFTSAEIDRNNPGSRYFINPHYRGSVTVRGDGTCQVRFPNSDHSGSNFPPPGKLMSPELLSRPPPPILNPLQRERPVGLPLRFPPPVNQSVIPPPQQVVRFSGLNGQLINKPSAPKNLMDVVLTTPSSFHGRPHPFSLDLLQPPRFHPQHLINAGDPSKFSDPRFLGPPPMTSGIKRHATSEHVSGAPLKQLRIGPTGNIQISRTFPNPAPASGSQMTSGNSALRIGASPGRQTQPSPATTTVSPTVSSSSVLESKTTPSPVKAPAPSMENLSSEEKEYFQKIEEQRKKREEVLRLKEERRRQKLALQGGNGEFSSIETTPPPVSKSDAFTSPPMTGRAQGVESASPNTSYSQTMPQNLAQPAIATENGAPIQQRKTQLVKPITPTGMNPNLAYPSTNHVIPQPGVNRRYKIIIVKNKSGKILEKRRVPIDETYRPISNETASLVTAEQSGAGLSVAGVRPLTTRISETITIENLDSKFTEDDVRNLCQIFGPVQEIYPKLHEGKAIVRFESAAAAKNFVCNHNTPGICVRYL